MVVTVAIAINNKETLGTTSGDLADALGNTVEGTPENAAILVFVASALDAEDDEWTEKLDAARAGLDPLD